MAEGVIASIVQTASSRACAHSFLIGPFTPFVASSSFPFNHLNKNLDANRDLQNH